MSDGLQLREADERDITVLVEHRWRMAEAIMRERGAAFDAMQAEARKAVYVEYLRRRLADGTVKAWVVEEGATTGTIVASGAVSFLPWVPSWRDSEQPLVGFVHSVFTDEKYRRRGCARQIMAAAIACCRSRGCIHAMLGASDAGRPLYESLGFVPATTMMRLPLR